jgi:hypothetical protein
MSIFLLKKSNVAGTLDDKKQISGGAVCWSGEGARARDLVAQAVAGLQLVGLALDANFQLSFNHEQMVF